MSNKQIWSCEEFSIFLESKMSFVDSSCFARASENAAYVKRLSKLLLKNQVKNKAKIVPIHQRNIAFLWKVFKPATIVFCICFVVDIQNKLDPYFSFKHQRHMYIYIHIKEDYIYTHIIYTYISSSMFFWSDLSIDP